MAASSIKYLVQYLEREGSEDDDFPWNKLTCLAVVCFVIRKKHKSSDIIRSLDLMAEEYLYAEDKGRRRKQEDEDVMKNSMHIISQLFINSFIPQAQMHFTVPEVDHLSDKDKNNLKKSEILAGFLDFLVQILYREANVDTAREQRYTPLRKSLLFLLAVLGDKPFDCSTLHSVLEDQVKDLLTEFEVLANEAGRFIYSCVFSVCPFDDEMFYAERSALLKKLEILNVKIKQHCMKFSELRILAVPVFNVVDSFFIIHSLVDDLDSFSAQNFFKISMFHDELRTSSLVVLECTGARQGDGDMKEPLVQIRDLAYEAEYLINSHVVGNIHAWYLDLRLPSITRNIRFARKKLQRIKELQPSQVMIRHGGEISDVTHATAVDDNHFVELEDNTTGKILSDLVGGYKKSREIISIYGMPGLGKTTIANKLYHCSSASSYFDRRAWCVVSQTYSVRSLLINILIHVARELKNDEILKKSDEELGVDIHKSLKQRRYLIVLDDVWHSNTWYDLQLYLPDDGNGSRVILTSRIKDASPHGSIFHTLPFFSEDQCLDLLEKKMFPGESCPPELLKIGRRIAKKCSGIPLAVVVTAGILANLKREENAWERVEKQLDMFLLDGLSDHRKILELSYEHLPHHLKPCFLYFAAFPEDAEISVIKLAWRWISEGFIPKNEGKTPEQVAQMYLSDLMNRSLVLPGKRRADGGTKTCRIHDLLLDVCVKKASEENFLNSDNELSIYEKHQRSYLLHMSNTDSRPFGLYSRSLIGGLPDRSSCFQTRALLKVLDIMPNKFQKFDSTSFDLPIHLRYLGVHHLTNKMVANLDNLEFINIVNSSQITVPTIVLRMKKLRHLIVKKEAIFEDKDYISETTNLRTLLYVCIYKRLDEMILRDSPHLLKLKCEVGGKIKFPDLSFLEKLETLKMVFSRSRGIKLSNLSFPSSIKNLCLSNAKIPWKQMSVIGKLPNLCVLKLEDRAFVGDEWETLDDEFKELRFLKIGQSNLRHWITCNEHFPKLERLVLFGCIKLVEIPYDLCDISTLQRIDVEFCLIRACLSAVRIEQDKHNNGDEEFWVNIITHNWTKEEVEELSKKIEKAENVSMTESDGNQIYELSSIICSPERDFLVRSDGEQVKVNSLKGKIVGIYFSTFRLESCQLFTQNLMAMYNALKKYGHFEIVLVSGDKDVDDESSKDDLSKWPWLAVPLTDSKTINKLDELFDVRTMPHLVILDEKGKVLTEEGVKIIEEGGGRGYPFVPKDILKMKKVEKEEDEAKTNESLESLLVYKNLDYVINNDKTKITVSSLVGKTMMFFFGAQRYEPCRVLSQQLIHVYQQINKQTNNSLEVIFISSSEDEFSFNMFFATMPWLALPFGDDRIVSLKRLFKVIYVPCVVVIGPNGKTLTSEGYKLISSYGVEAYPFTSERLKEIESENNKMSKLLPRKVRKEVHEHELGLVKRIIEYYICDSCDESGCDWSYYCEDCDFDLHPKCALGYDDRALESLLVSESRDYVTDFVGTKIPVSNLVGKTIMLFFACGWMSLHRSFVPTLIQAYQEINVKYNNSIEVIFISYDKDQFTFNEFFAMMPWLALPFDDDRRESLTRLFRVDEYSPYVVLIAPTGKTRTVEGYKLISCHGVEAYPFTSERIKEIESKNDIMGESWPKKVRKEVHEHELGLVKRTTEYYICDGCEEVGWDWSYYCEDCEFDLHPKCALVEDDKVEVKRNDSLESLLISKFRDYVIDSDKTQIQVSNLVGKTIKLFFAAHWCPPCRFVLPKLLQEYQENNKKHHNSVEVIFASSDEDISSFDTFFAAMPWLALPFRDNRIKSLIHLFKVKAIPMLVTIEPTGKTATNNAWELISYPGAEAYPFTYEWVQSQTKAQKMVIFWPKKVTNKLHDHELCLVEQILYDCDSCHEAGFDWSYKCEDCVFTFHPNCALRDDKAIVKDETEGEEKKTDTASGE